MIGMIKPLVKEAGVPKRSMIALGLFGVGAMVSAAALSAAVGSIAWVIRQNHRSSLSILGLAMAYLALSVCDFGLGGARPPSLRRQTCSTWQRTVGPNLAWFCWGIDLGLGFSTLRVTSLYWAVILAALVLLPAPAAPLVFGGYALGLMVNLCIALVVLRHLNLPGSAAGVLQLQRPARLASASVLLVSGAALLASAVA